MKAELCREIAVDSIGTGGRDMHVEADTDERRKLSARFGWIAIDRLEADVHLSTRAGGIDVTGVLRATVDQPCASTGEAVREQVDTDFAVRFVDAALLGGGQDEVELADDDLDVIEYEGATVDVGEAVAQTLALNVEAYPRGPDAGGADEDRIVFRDAEASPFGMLKGLLKP